MSAGFIKLKRGDATERLFRDIKAMHLLSVIAYRARYSREPSIDQLSYGQALIGDHMNYGLSRQEERSARRRLEKYNLATFKTSRSGTVATILDSRIFSLSDERESERSNHRANHQSPEENLLNPTSESTSGQPTADHQATTNQKESKTEEKKHTIPAGPATPSTAVENLTQPQILDNKLFDALAEACGRNPRKMTRPALRACRLALANIREADPAVNISELAARARRYHQIFPQAVLTPSALCRHWDECNDRPAQPRTQKRVAEPHKKWQEVMKRHYPEAVLLNDENNWKSGAWERLTAYDQGVVIDAWSKIPVEERMP